MFRFKIKRRTYIWLIYSQYLYWSLSEYSSLKLTIIFNSSKTLWMHGSYILKNRWKCLFSTLNKKSSRLNNLFYQPIYKFVF